MNTQVNSEREAVESFLSGKLAQVDVGKIERELKKLWQEAASGSDAAEHPQVIRACSCNLIMVTDRENAETADANALDEVVLRNPSRAILVINRQNGGGGKLDAWVSARCHMMPGAVTKQICSEQITVLAQDADDQQLTSVVESLLLGDLPIYLWWTLDSVNGEKLAPFLALAQRVIVDSARAPYSFRFLRELSALVESSTGCILVSDLNWDRLHGVRRALAEEFERSPLQLQDLQRIKKVVISTVCREMQEDDCSLQALLLVGWLADRLGWTPLRLERDAEKKSVARWNAADREVIVQFKSTSFEQGPLGSVFDVRLDLDDDRRLTVSRDAAGEQKTLLATIASGGKVVREAVMDDVVSAQDSLVCRELEEFCGDSIFANALAKAHDLIATISEKV